MDDGITPDELRGGKRPAAALDRNLAYLSRVEIQHGMRHKVSFSPSWLALKPSDS